MEHHIAVFARCTNISKSQKKKYKNMHVRVITSGQRDR